MKAIIIIPAYNEEKTVGNVIKTARKYGKVIVIDDASHDNTASVARACGASVISHKVNKGLGSALRTGFAAALRKNPDVIITLDGDGQHSPSDIPKFLRALESGHDFVLGYRDLKKYPFIKRFGNFFLESATNFVSGTALHDTESGFRAFRAGALRKLNLRAERYEIAVEIIFEVGRNKLSNANVHVLSPVYVKGVGMTDGVKNFLYLLRRRKRNLRTYIEDTRYVLRKKLTGR